MKCFECGWPRISRTREGERRCPRCGTAATPSAGRASSKPEGSKVARIYTGVLAVFALVFPFLVPIILKVSLANPDWAPWWL